MATKFEQWLEDAGACSDSRKFVRRRNGDFEASLRALLTRRNLDRTNWLVWLGDKLGWAQEHTDGWRSINVGFQKNDVAFGKFLRREAIRRGWM